MGCVASKREATSSPPFELSAASVTHDGSSGILAGSFWNRTDAERSESGESKVSSNGTSLQSFRLGNLYKYIEGEQVAAGWPSWLSAVAREAIYGWVPLRAESYEKLEKIGQGTYSNVFKARDLDTGKIVALKKVRFDNFEPESVRFMAREILILRRLNHPNIVKLEGLITSRMSCSIYLVFEYMEHDLAGLSSSPDIKFSESQVKCYMHQLLSGLEHCHSRGIMHRDIKCANILVSNEGIVKIADFGLANFCNSAMRQPLTSRVVTLWYRPPELLLGSTDYEPSVDLWSVGCVFAEIFLGKPVLQGRTEVEQIHKIFKLCGSPSDDYWRRNKLTHAMLFKPQQPYEKCLREKFKCIPDSAYRLLDTLLSIEPYKRGTPKSALALEYFKTKPYACEPSSLPKYAPNKEMDAKIREDSRRRIIGGGENGPEISRRPPRALTTKQLNDQSKLSARPEDINGNNSSYEEHSLVANMMKDTNKHTDSKKTDKWKRTYSANDNGANKDLPRKGGESRLLVDLQPKPSIERQNDARQSQQESQAAHFSGPLPSSDFSGLIWAKKHKEEHPSNEALREQAQEDVEAHRKQFDLEKQAMLDKWIHAEEHHDPYRIESSEHYDSGYEDRIELSGPLLREDKIDELLEKHERHIRHAVRKSWLQRG